MKVEIRLNEKENSSEDKHENSEIMPPSCDVAIDIGQILAANQALLKNMARRMETLENKLVSMEKAYLEQSALLQLERSKATLMLDAPRKEIKAWQPVHEKLDHEYFNRFSVIDRIFRPWVMRRENH